ncbi:hypothetical protein Q4491_00170 [Photobacterium sp. 2_MG-2023]|uniref:hypothetical protein n=1 Tax=Photobacterium sp. 2_MG-2023 TaxID=3062663 RepID=UPI0026E2F2A9|nr:hypothetical protein [Photobacterium sp. 2_MG-2023]MDO6579745.1 hypothetical protein [Photobacterium sp. 2_MG-2023]
MKKILMVCYGGGHVKIIASLYQSLKSKYDIHILALTTASSYLKNIDIPHNTVESFRENIPNEALCYGEELAREIGENGIIPLSESVCYLGVSFYNLVKRLGSEKKARELYQEYGRSCFLPTEFLSDVIDLVSPDIVVTTNAPRFERATLIAAKNKIIPSLCINDNLWIENGALQLIESECVDYLCVVTHSVKNLILKRTGFPEEKILVTGNPVFDLIKRSPAIRNNNDKPRVLYADCKLPMVHPFYHDIVIDKENLDVDIRLELERLACMGAIDVTFRAHPNQQIDYSGFSSVSFSSHKDSIHDIIHNFDVVVTAISTVGLEGLIAGLGLVTIEGTVYNKKESYSKLGLSTPIYEANSLLSAIKKEISREGNKISNDLYQGLASDNISMVIRNLIGQ